MTDGNTASAPCQRIVNGMGSWAIVRCGCAEDHPIHDSLWSEGQPHPYDPLPGDHLGRNPASPDHG